MGSPNRYGQAYLAYIGGKYGDQAVTDLFKRGGQVRLDSAYVELFGVSADSLTQEWGRATRDAYRPLLAGRTPPDSAGTWSPDGRRLTFHRPGAPSAGRLTARSPFSAATRPGSWASASRRAFDS